MRVSTLLSYKLAMLAAALLTMCAYCPADTVVSVNDSVVPINRGGLFLGGTYSNIVAVSWTQATAASNVTIVASVASADPTFITGTAYLMNAIGTGATAANEVVPPAPFTAALAPAYLDQPMPLTVLFSGLNLEPGTYYLVLSAPSATSPAAGGPLGWQIANQPVVTTASSVTLGATYLSNTSFTTVNSFPPASQFEIDPVDRPIFDVVSGSQATFVGLDKTSQGNWSNSYGYEGYVIPGDIATQLDHSIISFAQFFEYTWAAATSDPRALLISPSSKAGIASAITNYSGESFYINLNVYDNKPHRLALYLLDWDTSSRSETVTITDASTGELYSTETFSGFQNGEYAFWQVKGNLTIKVTPNSVVSAVVSGIFID